MDLQSLSTASDQQQQQQQQQRSDSMNGRAQNTEDLFEKLHEYRFISDSEFAKGLSIILGHPNEVASQAEINRDDDDLVLQAKCFYFSRKEKLTTPLDFRSYKAWLSSRATTDSRLAGESVADELSETGSPPSNIQPSTDESTDQPSAQTQAQDPAYPTSFAHIVDLITSGKPIPGIEQIPDTVLTGHDLSSSKAKRRKPWEKDESDQAVT